MNNLQNFALNLLMRNPRIANNPQAQTMINAIRSGDQKRGEEIANNICRANGVSKEDAINSAKQFFKL